MNYKEALEIAESTNPLAQGYVVFKKAQYVECIINALQKQIPVKPIYKEMYYEDIIETFVCPKCSDKVGQITSNGKVIHNHHCRCGQAIDWADID